MICDSDPKVQHDYVGTAKDSDVRSAQSEMRWLSWPANRNSFSLNASKFFWVPRFALCCKKNVVRPLT